MELTKLPPFDQLEVGNSVKIARHVRDGDLSLLGEVPSGPGHVAAQSFTSWIWLVYIAKFLPTVAPSLVRVRRLVEAEFLGVPRAGSPLIIEVRVDALEPIDADTGLVACACEAGDGERAIGRGTAECVWRRQSGSSWWGDDETDLVAPPM
jgi:hypothetical protein